MNERSSHMQEHDTGDLLDHLENSVVTAKSMPFSNSCLVDREEMLVLIGMIRDSLPAELKQAKWLLEQNRQLIAEARKEAETMIREAESRMTSMIDEHEITQKARQQANQTLEAANHSAKMIRNGSMEYARKRLADLEEQLSEMLATVQRNKQDLK
ncbi:MAG: ATPase [Clostridia bacterium]|nr:ATPase [Eubacteriales bacterium]MDD3867188.1 ATPase [Eubacteriales bacterium]MDD4462435.1 ATPase [Eubacteriales bacterium]NCC49377.1 ATPase [Clostridia bacterium]